MLIYKDKNIYRKDKSVFNKIGSEQLFIFNWEGSIVEAHTKQTFINQYNKNCNSELWDKDSKMFCYNDNAKNIIEDIFDIDWESMENLRDYDNMQVYKI